MNLKIAHIMLSGEFPFKRKLKENEINKLIEEGWFIIREKTNPLLQKKVMIERAKKKKSSSLMLNMNGFFIITGIKTRK